MAYDFPNTPSEDQQFTPPVAGAPTYVWKSPRWIIKGQTPSADWPDITNKPATFPPTVPIAWTDVSGKPTTFTPAAHVHPQSDITNLTTDLAARVLKAGDTMTGGLIIRPVPGPASLILDKPASGDAAYIQARMGNKNRWLIYMGDQTAEPNNESGSNFSLYSYNDLGSVSTLLLSIPRLTGIATFSKDVIVNGSFTSGIGTTRIDHSGYSGTPISTLVGGSTTGGLIEGPLNGHLALGIRDNDVNDSVSIVSYNSTGAYSKLVAQFKADGSASVAGAFTCNALVSTGTIYHGGYILANPSTLNTVIAPNVASGASSYIMLRPQGLSDLTGELRLFPNGTLEVKGDATQGTLFLQNGLATGALNMTAGQIFFRGYSAAGTPVMRNYGDIYCQVTTITSGAEESQFVFRINDAGQQNSARMSLNGGGLTVTGQVLASTAMYVNGGAYFGSAAMAALCNSGGAGTVYLRPNANTTTGQLAVASTGNVTIAGDLTVTGGQVTASYHVGPTTQLFLCTTTAGNIYFRPNGTASGVGQCSINSAGLLTVASDLVVSGNNITCSTIASPTTQLILATTGAGTVFLRANGSGSGVDFRVASSGDCTIYTTASLYAGAGLYSRAVNNGAYNTAYSIYPGFINGDGTHIYVNGADQGKITFTSDYRFKQDVKPLPRAWDKVKALRPITYLPNEPGEMKQRLADKVYWGFIAHELQETLTETAANGYKDIPDYVQTPDPWSVLAALTNVVQELMVRIEAAETKPAATRKKKAA